MLLLVITACNSSPEAISPDRNVRIGLQLTEQGTLKYDVDYKDTSVVEDALLGLVLENGDTLGNRLEIVKVQSKVLDDSYPVFAGKCDSVRNHCVETTVQLVEKQGYKRKLNIVLRAYNDGVAFRYIVPNQPTMYSYNLLGELSQFSLTGENKMWAQTVSKFYKNHYEHPYRSVAFDSIPAGTIIQLPLVFEGPGYAGAISEADLKDYAGLYLQKSTLEDASLVATLSRVKEEDVPVKLTDSIVTPWRFIMLADDAIKLVNSNLVYNLSTPCEIENTDWIKPGKVAWDWWNDQNVANQPFRKGMNNATMKYFIDFAAEIGLEYMLIDAGWYGAADDTIADITKCVPEFDIKELVAYGQERNVGIILWANWINVRNQLEEAFKVYSDWGIKGLKIDYMDGDLQPIVDFYYKTAECAARHKLLVDFHGAYKPTGLGRTYPNVMTYEGVLGLEHCKWSMRITPEHNVTIPFTRMLVGPMDYTPGAMDNRTEEDFVPSYSSPSSMGTRAHQLAMYVVYESPLQMLSDHPAAYRGQATTEFLKRVPSTWSETLPLEREIGKYIVLARRNKSEWFLGGMNGNEERTVTIPFGFLQEGNEYQALIVKDATDSDLHPQHVCMEKMAVDNKDSLSVKMVKGGGFVIVLSEK